ncbi:hypothetical protein M8818_007195 [Zalaria obscura]|uniref:Uncharacterized protein n=1 Tax=Zalaria obscura TaxID=2024903 RepID=A0ACC3S496_9PEZI
MSWLWGSGNNDPSKDDPTKNLDPSLKEFLNKESHSKPTSTPSTTASAPPSTDGAPNEYRSKIGLNPPAQPSTNSDKPAVPAESLYQDGRYADIWKTYKPLSEIESTMKTDQERMFDVVDAYNDRRAQIASTIDVPPSATSASRCCNSYKEAPAARQELLAIPARISPMNAFEHIGACIETRPL